MYTDYLASRGYRRVLIERTDKAPGHLVLPSATKPVERIPSKVLQLAGRAIQQRAKRGAA